MSHNSSRDIPKQVAIPTACALIFAAMVGFYKLKHINDFDTGLMLMLIFYGFCVAQFVSIAWGCRKIPKKEVLAALGLISIVFFYLHHLAEKNPYLFIVSDFIILEVVCVAFGIHWRNKYYPEQIKKYHSDCLSNFIANFLDALSHSVKTIKDKLFTSTPNS